MCRAPVGASRRRPNPSSSRGDSPRLGARRRSREPDVTSFGASPRRGVAATSFGASPYRGVAATSFGANPRRGVAVTSSSIRLRTQAWGDGGEHAERNKKKSEKAWRAARRSTRPLGRTKQKTKNEDETLSKNPIKMRASTARRALSNCSCQCLGVPVWSIAHNSIHTAFIQTPSSRFASAWTAIARRSTRARRRCARPPWPAPDHPRSAPSLRGARRGTCKAPRFVFAHHPRRARGVAALHGLSTSRGRGVAAMRLHGISTSRVRGVAATPSLRTIQLAANSKRRRPSSMIFAALACSRRALEEQSFGPTRSGELFLSPSAAAVDLRSVALGISTSQPRRCVSTDSPRPAAAASPRLVRELSARRTCSFGATIFSVSQRIASSRTTRPSSAWMGMGTWPSVTWHATSQRNAGASRNETASAEPSASNFRRTLPAMAMPLTLRSVVKLMPLEPSTHASAVQAGVHLRARRDSKRRSPFSMAFAALACWWRRLEGYRKARTGGRRFRAGVHATSHSESCNDFQRFSTISGLEASDAGNEQSQYRSPVTKPSWESAFCSILVAMVA